MESDKTKDEATSAEISAVSEENDGAVTAGVENGNYSKLWLIISGSFFLVALALALAAYFTVQMPPDSDSLRDLSVELSRQNGGGDQPELVRRRLDGVLVEPGGENPYPLAVVLDNHPDARPQAGLAEAMLVFEVPAEGVTTRFLAIFGVDADLSEIGPVRSARPYFLDWTEELSAAFVHCGGSPAALAELAVGGINDINEFYKGHLFWRADDRTAPHSVMTATAKLKEHLSGSKYAAGAYDAWNYKDESPVESGASTTVMLSIPAYGIDWRYDRETNAYRRYGGSRAIKDADGKEIIAKNVAVLFTDMKVLDEQLRLEIKTTGEGRARICLDGVCREGKWRKPDEESRTRFYYENDEEVAFNAGTTWIEVVRLGEKVSFGN